MASLVLLCSLLMQLCGLDQYEQCILIACYLYWCALLYQCRHVEAVVCDNAVVVLLFNHGVHVILFLVVMQILEYHT